MTANRRDFLISATGVGGMVFIGAGAALAAPAK
ncbi:MAG: hypothetical protein JWM33_1690, partial [Caulobacteraceae bacterium]|nr:hypothetical protein [Caulobacteraceae bacterium]